jgi:LuxR family maltose regulon positive regulatory protein
MLDASMADASSEPLAMGSELHGVALLNLGIVETWTGRLLEAERHLSDGAALARRIGRPYLEVACRAHQGFPSVLVSVAAARERGHQAVVLAERYGLEDRPILAPALGAVGGMAIWMGEFAEGKRWLRRAWEVGSAHLEPATAVFLHLTTGMLYAGRGQQRSALEAFAAAARAQSLLTGVHALAPRITGWLATTQARLGLPAEARNARRIFPRTRAYRRHLQRASMDLPRGREPRPGIGGTPSRSGRHPAGRTVHAC